ncbi:hypothetical protein, partial [Falsiroseomonas oryziterrae]|uniref:hypothetical protein n=1 Tax=Falsiroseomonas oryziterrae TaxID=2911368 RepID=UPI001F47160F
MIRRAARLASWRGSLDERLARVCAAWGLVPAGGLSETPTARLVAIGDDHVLKLAPPGQGVEAEIATLRAMQGRGVVALHRADPAEGALLLARARPGT